MPLSSQLSESCCNSRMDLTMVCPYELGLSSSCGLSQPCSAAWALALAEGGKTQWKGLSQPLLSWAAAVNGTIHVLKTRTHLAGLKIVSRKPPKIKCFNWGGNPNFQVLILTSCIWPAKCILAWCFSTSGPGLNSYERKILIKMVFSCSA